jgi:hypothetical protein
MAHTSGTESSGQVPGAPAAITEYGMPVLSAGRHRNARRGACFMEYASYLAGARWSDHPTCTHPTLSALARLVNDLTSDRRRDRLAPYIPSVVGLIGDDPRVPVIVSALAAATALPIASEPRQRALATALVRCDLLLANWSGPDIERMRMRIRLAFLLTPGVEDWARDFVTGAGLPVPLTLHDDAILRTATIGIADACVQDSDARLEGLLATAIAECAALLRTGADTPAGTSAAAGGSELMEATPVPRQLVGA